MYDKKQQKYRAKQGKIKREMDRLQKAENYPLLAIFNYTNSKKWLLG